MAALEEQLARETDFSEASMCVFMCVCVHACMYVCLYACMHVCRCMLLCISHKVVSVSIMLLLDPSGVSIMPGTSITTFVAVSVVLVDPRFGICWGILWVAELDCKPGRRAFDIPGVTLMMACSAVPS